MNTTKADMASWIYDANITKDTIEAFESVDIRGVHIVYDLGYASDTEDDEVISIAQKKKKTLVTGDYSDFLGKPNSKLKDTYGVWIFNTKDPDKRKKIFKLAIGVTKLKTIQARKGKKVYMKDNQVDVLDCRTGKQQTIGYNQNTNEKSKKKASKK